MRDHFLSFMEKIFQNDHAEIAPPLREEEERWYLPTFGVHHPKKPGQIWVVFDSSAQYEGVSLNDVLLTGPDLNNSLLGVLICFRKESNRCYSGYTANVSLLSGQREGQGLLEIPLV